MFYGFKLILKPNKVPVSDFEINYDKLSISSLKTLKIDFKAV